jgi:hypothetical protein
MNPDLEKLKYPIGKFSWPATVSASDILKAIESIAKFPAQIRNAVVNLSDDQVDTPYRPEGWTVRQLVHHCADSHLNACVRFKLALTEHDPTIKPYDQPRWAELADSQLDPAISLGLIDGIHEKWVVMMKAMQASDWSRGFIHPEHNQRQMLQQVVMMYAWHSEHHLTHILRLKERMGWNEV